MSENAYVHVANLITVFQNFAYEILKVAFSLKPLSWTASINMIENIQKQLNSGVGSELAASSDDCIMVPSSLGGEKVSW